MVGTLIGLVLCALGLGLLAWVTRTVWRGMVRHDSPTPAERSRRANAAGAHLYGLARPQVVKVRFTRRRFVGQGNGESKK